MTDEIDRIARVLVEGLRLSLARKGRKPEAFDVAHRKPDELYRSHRVVLVFKFIGPAGQLEAQKVSSRCAPEQGAPLVTAIANLCSSELGLWPAERSAA